MLTVKVFLITILEEVKSTSEINCFGIVVYNAFSSIAPTPDSKFVASIRKSVISLAVAGSFPSKIPVTVVTPVTVTLLFSRSILVILAPI